MLGLAVVFGGISIFVADSLVKGNADAGQIIALPQAVPQKVVEFKKIVVAKAALRYGTELSADVLTEID